MSPVHSVNYVTGCSASATLPLPPPVEGGGE